MRHNHCRHYCVTCLLVEVWIISHSYIWIQFWKVFQLLPPTDHFQLRLQYAQTQVLLKSRKYCNIRTICNFCLFCNLQRFYLARNKQNGSYNDKLLCCGSSRSRLITEFNAYCCWYYANIAYLCFTLQLWCGCSSEYSWLLKTTKTLLMYIWRGGRQWRRFHHFIQHYTSTLSSHFYMVHAIRDCTSVCFAWHCQSIHRSRIWIPYKFHFQILQLSSSKCNHRNIFTFSVQHDVVLFIRSNSDFRNKNVRNNLSANLRNYPVPLHLLQFLTLRQGNIHPYCQLYGPLSWSSCLQLHWDRIICPYFRLVVGQFYYCILIDHNHWKSCRNFWLFLFIQHLFQIKNY